MDSQSIYMNVHVVTLLAYFGACVDILLLLCDSKYYF